MNYVTFVLLLLALCSFTYWWNTRNMKLKYIVAKNQMLIKLIEWLMRHDPRHITEAERHGWMIGSVKESIGSWRTRLGWEHTSLYGSKSRFDEEAGSRFGQYEYRNGNYFEKGARVIVDGVDKTEQFKNTGRLS